MTDSATLSRYDRRREEILQAATTLINQSGVSGMTMRHVAQMMNLTPATLAYYFKGKEDLANAVFQRRLDSLEHIVSEAAKGATPDERVETLLSLELDRLGKVFSGQAEPLAALPSSNESLEYLQVRSRIGSLFARIDTLFGEPDSDEEKDLIRARSYMLIGVLFYMFSWVSQYPVDELPRIKDRIMDLLRTGFAPADFQWEPQIFAVDEFEGDSSAKVRPEFLRAATRLLNVSGYLGTSVDSIAEELNVTKGSFYHHLESKDELVLECIRSNFSRISRATGLSKAEGGSHLQQVSSTIATLLELQFEHQWPLLRSTAYSSLPPELRNMVTARSNRAALTFASSLIDGIVEGSVRAVDPLIASHLINSTLYSALGLEEWASRLPRHRAIALYASTLTRGIFDPGVLQELRSAPPPSS